MVSGKSRGSAAEDGRGRSSWLGKIVAVLLVLSGLAIGYGALLLARLGGSLFFIAEAALLLAAGFLLWRGSKWALWVHGALLLLALGWTWLEAGLDPWAMLPRLSLVYLLALLLAVPWTRRGLAGGPQVGEGARRVIVALAALAAFGLPLAAILLGSYAKYDPAGPIRLVTSNQGTGDDWADWGGTAGGVRFSRLDQINAGNVGKLKVAWTYSFGAPKPDGLQLTPLKIGDSVYACDSRDVVVSLDADTGKERWKFDAHPKEWAPWTACRGVGYAKVADAGACAERLFLATSDARIIAIDAKTGRKCAGFGNGGDVNALDGLGPVEKGYYWFNNAPNVFAGKVVVSGSQADNQHWLQPSGVIRAYDAVTGKLAWAYDVGAPGRIGAPEDGKPFTPGTPNAWAQMSYDPQLNTLYAGTGNATPDYYGAQRRPFDEEITSAVLALDMTTGRRKWLFQTVHHDVWDYDIGSQPVLFDMTKADGTVVHALAQPTKRAQVFVLDRETGKPIVPVEERPVPQAGKAPGERLAATQPFSTFPSFAGDPLSEAKMWGISPFDNLWCRIRYKEARYDGPLTPPGLTPSITYPGFLGGMDWAGISIDPERAILVAATSYVPNYTRLVPRAEAGGVQPMGKAVEGMAALIGLNAQAGTPYAVGTGPFLSPLTMPCTAPPWGRVSAVDMRTNKTIWSRPLGTGKENGPLGIRSIVPLTIGAPVFGGSVATRGGLVFTAAATDSTIRAFETATGKLLWEAPLPFSGNSDPITYRSQASGRQYLLVPAGGHHTMGTPAGDTLVAFALEK